MMRSNDLVMPLEDYLMIRKWGYKNCSYDFPFPGQN